MEINLRASQSWKPEVFDAPDLELPDVVPTAMTANCHEKPRNKSWESAETTVGEEKFGESDPRSSFEPASTDPGWLLNTLDSWNSCNVEEEEFDDPEATLGSIARQKRKQQDKAAGDQLLCFAQEGGHVSDPCRCGSQRCADAPRAVGSRRRRATRDGPRSQCLRCGLRFGFIRIASRGDGVIERSQGKKRTPVYATKRDVKSPCDTWINPGNKLLLDKFPGNGSWINFREMALIFWEFKLPLDNAPTFYSINYESSLSPRVSASCPRSSP